MNQDNKLIIVELAVHKNIINHFHMEPLCENQIISSSALSEYNILTVETVDYMEIIPTIQQFLPLIKVIMPIELDSKIRDNINNYDTQDLEQYAKAN